MPHPLEVGTLSAPWTYTADGTLRSILGYIDARGTVTPLSCDQLGRLTERRVVSPFVPDPVLAANTYDEARAGFFNIGSFEPLGLNINGRGWRE